MLLKKISKYHRIIIFLIFILVGVSTYLFCLPPQDENDTLQMMRLNTDTIPIFKLESQMTYTPELLAQLQRCILLEPSKASTLQNLNIGITLQETTQFEQIASEIISLSDCIPNITISLFPSSQINGDAYIDAFVTFSHLFKNMTTSHIELILYPDDISNLSIYSHLDSVTSIGISIDYPLDLNKVKSIYEHFKDSKTIYIKENIINSEAHIGDCIKDINLLYYTLALEYPKCQTIFSPFMKLPFELQDSTVLTNAHSDYATYQTIYARLLNEPWLTMKETTLGNESPYVPLGSYDELSGIEELLLSPHSSLISSTSNKSDDISRVNSLHYRLEEQELTIQSYYPYVVQIDTTTNPNGITRFKAIASDHTGEVVDVQSIDVIINNETTSLRAERYLGDISFTSSPIYGSSYIPILMYHSIADEVAVEDNNHTVQTELFDAQMKALIDSGYTPINFKMLNDYLNGENGLPEKPILITMDDGYLNNYTHAYPIYKKYNISATLFVSPYYMKEENTDRHFGWTAAKEMEDSGLIDIQSHGYNHTPLSYLSLKDVKYHVSHSKGLIEQYLGPRDVFVVAYPQFRNTIYTRNLLSEIGVDFQITKLAKVGTGLSASHLKRINVPNTMSPEELITTIEKLTQ